ncbi:MAG: D-tagatose-bisphosphate aldolase, class II, non-catalytic subunit [Proteobacteria bacterium]|nr:D-tagatose-bisphosphate aldolase, class II, non-catalytic subunit [Pseudomonadota bacterium]
MKALQELIARHKAGERVGIYSVCSAHPLVLEAALREASARNQPILIEATSNQVNQAGGYTGMNPAQFRDYLADIAASAGVPARLALLGGDHLGPNTWRALPAEEALGHASSMVASYVAAGFRKVHLDCSMSCAGDPEALGDEIVAARAAQLCRVAERSWRECGGEAPVYVIGTEVPPPGGAHEELQQLQVTAPAAVTVTLEAHRRAFAAAGLEEAWARVIALVVQPGVEFDNDKVVDYQPPRAQALSQRIEQETGLVYEAHSTDYQTPRALADLVRDHFAILKVGPGATFALREGLWALAAIERALGIAPALPLPEVVMATMRDDPRHWKGWYAQKPSLEYELQFSLSDRIRYYWSVPQVQQAVAALLSNLARRALPSALLSQYLPAQYAAVRAGTLEAHPRALLLDVIANALRPYAQACRPGAA